jgi:hypothetical protein
MYYLSQQQASSVPVTANHVAGTRACTLFHRSAISRTVEVVGGGGGI